MTDAQRCTCRDGSPWLIPTQVLCGKPKSSWTVLLPKTLNYSPVKGKSPLCRPAVEAEATRWDNQLITFQLRLQPRGKIKTWLVSIPQAVSWKLEMHRETEQYRDDFREAASCILQHCRGHGSPRKHLSPVVSVMLPTLGRPRLMEGLVVVQEMPSSFHVVLCYPRILGVFRL